MEILLDNMVLITLFCSVILTAIIAKGLIYASEKMNLFRIDVNNNKIPKFLGGIIPISFGINLILVMILTKILDNVTFELELLVSLVFGCVYFFIIGYLFDNNQIVAKKKIWYEVIGILILSVFGQKILLMNLWFENGISQVIEQIIAIILTMIWYFVVINAVNISRAIDRLVTGISLIVSICIFFIGVIVGIKELVLISAILVGITLILTLFNLNVNNITGLTLGFIMASITIKYLIKSPFMLILSILVLGVPIFNFIYVIYKRLKRGTIVTVRDDEHFFYKLKNGGYTTSQILRIMYIVSFSLALLCIMALKNNNEIYLAISIIIVAIFGILVDKKTKKEGKITVMSIFGTRPEAIKMAPVIKALDKIPEINNVICVTGQHKEMLYQVLDIFDMKPKYDLNIMRNRQTIVGVSSRILKVLEKVVKREKPDLILVHGDTTSTFVGAFLGFYMQVKVGHVEAGLRTYNRKEPFPEEINRVLTGAIADYHFAPSIISKNNLLKEGVSENSIYLTGNTVVDATKYTYKEDYNFKEKVLNDIDYEKNKVIMMTAHRRENVGEPLVNICKAVKRIVEDNKDVVVVYAVHKNPAVRDIVYKILKGVERVHLVEPIDVADMHNLMKRSYLALTDSGGLQEEAPSFNLPTIVLRNVTERPEGLETGILKLAGTDEDKIYKIAVEILKDKKKHDKMANTLNPYGDSYAAERIVNAICYEFGLTDKKLPDFDMNSKVNIEKLLKEENNKNKNAI